MAPNDEIIKKLEATLRHANDILFKRGRAVLANMDISELQYNALLSIREYGPLTMGELCKKLFVACSTATDLADRMEFAGLVERVRDEKDRRVVMLHLLTRGNEALDAVILERRKFISDVLKEYSDEEYQELSRSSALLAERMELRER